MTQEENTNSEDKNKPNAKILLFILTVALKTLYLLYINSFPKNKKNPQKPVMSFLWKKRFLMFKTSSNL